MSYTDHIKLGNSLVDAEVNIIFDRFLYSPIVVFEKFISLPRKEDMIANILSFLDEEELKNFKELYPYMGDIVSATVCDLWWEKVDGINQPVIIVKIPKEIKKSHE